MAELIRNNAGIGVASLGRRRIAIQVNRVLIRIRDFDAGRYAGKQVGFDRRVDAERGQSLLHVRKRTFAVNLKTEMTIAARSAAMKADRVGVAAARKIDLALGILQTRKPEDAA